MKNKRILVLFLVLIALLGIMSIKVNAVGNYEIEKTVEGTDGTIEFLFNNITFDEANDYEWGISKTQNETGVEEWYSFDTYNVEQNTALITLAPENTTVLDILKTTDTAYIYIKNTTENTNVLDGVEVDLTLPKNNVFQIQQFTNSTENEIIISHDNANLGEAVYGIDEYSFQFIEVEDQSIIDAYNEAKENGTDIYSIDLSAISDTPSDGWILCDGNVSGYKGINNEDTPKEKGLYALWLRTEDPSTKTIYGFILYELEEDIVLDTEGPTVTSISVTSPNSGSYGVGQEVKIRVEFNEEISYMSSNLPTLTIKFGNGPEREAVYSGDTSTSISANNSIEYSYTIQDSDEGQLTVVSLEGGNIIDSNGNQATLSTPELTGNTIIARRNIDIDTGNDNNNDNNDNNNQNNDDTTAPGNIPQTGENILMISLIIGVTIVSIVGFIKFRKFKDIK